MKEITVTNLNGGIDIKNDPSVIKEDTLADCVGFDITQEGILQTGHGLATNDISAYLPSSDVQCVQFCYIGATKYVLASTSTGLYVNGTLKTNDVTGRFKAISFMSNIYIFNGSFAKRFDGTTCYKCGIEAPADVPTITPSTHLSRVLDNFDSLVPWIANASNCTVAAETTIKKEGVSSAKFTVAANATGYSYVSSLNIDGSTFLTGEPSTTDDYIRFWLYIDTLANLTSLGIFIDVGDGTFGTDYFHYIVNSSGENNVSQVLGKGSTTELITEETVTTAGEQIGWNEYIDNFGNGQVTPIMSGGTSINVRTIQRTTVQPVLIDQSVSFQQAETLFTLTSGAWTEVRLPKSVFVQRGDTSKDWNTIVGIKIEVIASGSGTVNVYVDDLKVIGGSDLSGDYWFMYAWGRQDSDGNILHESAPARNRTTRELVIQGPVKFDREPLSYGTRVDSDDPQVDCCLLYTIGGSLGNFWLLTKIDNNTTVGGTVYSVGDKTVSRMLLTPHNEPAPPGTDVVLSRNKIWLIGDPEYPSIIRSSDILADGTIAPEAWPTRNAYEPSEQAGRFSSIRVLNEQLIARSNFGEWSIRVDNPVDFLAVAMHQVSDKGLIGQDAIISLENSDIYPSNKGFVESTGQSTKFILPEVEPLIGMELANTVGAHVGLVSYLSFDSNLLGERTAKIDLYRGTPRISYINNIFLTWIVVDKETDTVYGVKNGSVYILDSGNVDQSMSYGANKELWTFLKSRTYRPGPVVTWTKMVFSHNTGGIWYQLKLYFDGVYYGSIPFTSTVRTKTTFNQFGPVSASDFQFEIEAYRTQPGTIYFPIRIYHSG